MSDPQNTRSSNVSAIVRIFLAAIGRKQNALCGVLKLSESQVSRRLAAGSWTVDELDRLAEFFDVSVTEFFEDPEVIRRRTLGVRPLPWITTPPNEDVDAAFIAMCEGQLDLLDAA